MLREYWWSSALAVAGLLAVLTWLTPRNAQAMVVYEFNGACVENCGLVGLTAGDAVAGSVSAGFVDINIGSDVGFGSADTMDTNDPLATTYDPITGTSDGTNLSALSLLFNGANLYEFDSSGVFGGSSPQWFFSHTSGLVFPQGDGAWTRQSTAVDGAFTYDFAGTCTNNCSDVGLSSGDAVSGAVSGGFVDLAVGSNILNTSDTFLDGITIEGTSDGTTLTDLLIRDTGNANVFTFNDLRGLWELSLSAQPLAVRYSGEWTVRGGGNDNGIVLVPEPGTLALFSAALLGLGFVARRRQSNP